MGDRGSPQFILTSAQFDVLYDLTEQELREYILGNSTMEEITPPMLNLLVEILGSVRDHVSRSSRLRILVVETSATDFVAMSAVDFLEVPYTDTASSNSRGEEEITVKLPKAIAIAWQPALKLVVAKLGDKEIRYRTGFYPDQVLDAIGALTFQT